MTPPPPPRPLVLVLDGDVKVRMGLTNLLRDEGYEVEAFAEASSLLTHDPKDGPRCMVVALTHPGLDGLSFQRQLKACKRHEEIVFVTGSGTIAQGVEAMKQGAVDYLATPFDDEALLAAVAEGLIRSASNHRLRGEIDKVRARVATFTPREFQVFRLVAAGWLNKQIAADLGTAIQTVKIHRARVMHKLGVVSVADLVRFAELTNVPPGRRGDS